MFTCFCLKGVIKTKFLSKLKIVHYFWHRIMRESLKAKQNYSSMFDKDLRVGFLSPALTSLRRRVFHQSCSSQPLYSPKKGSTTTSRDPPCPSESCFSPGTFNQLSCGLRPREEVHLRQMNSAQCLPTSGPFNWTTLTRKMNVAHKRTKGTLLFLNSTSETCTVELF